MTIHAKNGNLGCISFRFMIFLFSEGDTPPPSYAPEGWGGGELFSGKKGGYDMTIHAKIGKPGCISFRFMNFLFSEGGTSPLVTPLKGGGVIFFFI